MKKFRFWHGTDASNSESLFEYGFLIRWNCKIKMYDVIYAVDYDSNCKPKTFVYDTWDADDWREMLSNGEYDLKGIADMCGMDEETYLDEISDVNLLNDLLAYYGGYELGLGDYCVNHTESEVRKRLNKALD